MTVASNPTRKPPNATVEAMRTILNTSPVMRGPAAQGAELCGSSPPPQPHKRVSRPYICNRFQECCLHGPAGVKGSVPQRPRECHGLRLLALLHFEIGSGRITPATGFRNRLLESALDVDTE